MPPSRKNGAHTRRPRRIKNFGKFYTEVSEGHIFYKEIRNSARRHNTLIPLKSSTGRKNGKLILPGEDSAWPGTTAEM